MASRQSDISCSSETPARSLSVIYCESAPPSLSIFASVICARVTFILPPSTYFTSAAISSALTLISNASFSSSVASVEYTVPKMRFAVFFAPAPSARQASKKSHTALYLYKRRALCCDMPSSPVYLLSFSSGSSGREAAISSTLSFGMCTVSRSGSGK